jgi:predicted MFS family arabinose efflux permease
MDIVAHVLGGDRHLRATLLLSCSVVLVDTMLYAALTPLLPRFAHELDLTKTGAGLLVAAYAAGALVGGLPGGMAAARFGPRKAVLGGLAMMAAASVDFAFAGSATALWVARFAQGAGSALMWAGAFAWLVAVAPRERRGELLGTALGVAVFGALLGPVLGAVAALTGRAAAFTFVAGFAVVLGAWALRVEDAPAEEMSLAVLAEAMRRRRFLGGLGLMVLPSLLFGVLAVLAPLHLAAAGWGAVAISAVWLVSAGIEAVEAPLVGRFSDRRGRLLPVRVGLTIAIFVYIPLAFAERPLFYVPLLMLATASTQVLFSPGLAVIADAAEEVGLAQGLGFGMMNAGWAIGNVVGAAAAGAIAHATSDAVPMLLSAALCAIGLAAVHAAPARTREVRA